MKRNNLDISADILRVARPGAGKTRIVYHTNINFSLGKKYLVSLTSRGLLKKVGPQYMTTRQGEEWIRDYAKLTGSEL